LCQHVIIIWRQRVNCKLFIEVFPCPA
jgi:hypothetical protein